METRMGSFAIGRGATVVTVTPDEAHPNVLHLDQNAETVLIQVDPDTYEVRRGLRHLGDVRFRTEDCNYGWYFSSRMPMLRNSRRLFPNPEAALATRGITVDVVIGLGIWDATVL